MKTCTQCGESKPRTKFRKYAGRSSDGLRPLCKVCQKAYEREWRRKNKDKLKKARKARREADKKYRTKYYREHRGELLAKSAIARSKKKNLPCDLEKYLEDIEARFQKGVCEMTGLPFNFQTGGKTQSWDSPSIHRMDPQQGYLYSNIRIVCWGLNAALGTWGKEHLIKMVNAMNETEDT